MPKNITALKSHLSYLKKLIPQQSLPAWTEILNNLTSDEAKQQIAGLQTLIKVSELSSGVYENNYLFKALFYFLAAEGALTQQKGISKEMISETNIYSALRKLALCNQGYSYFKICQGLTSFAMATYYIEQAKRSTEITVQKRTYYNALPNLISAATGNNLGFAYYELAQIFLNGVYSNIVKIRPHGKSSVANIYLPNYKNYAQYITEAIKQNYEPAVVCLQKNYMQSLESMVAFATLQEKGEGILQNQQSAFILYVQASIHQNAPHNEEKLNQEEQWQQEESRAEAHYRLSLMYGAERGIIPKNDVIAKLHAEARQAHAEARQTCLQGFANSHGRLFYELGKFYNTLNHITPTHPPLNYRDIAAKYHEIAANLGYYDSFYELGVFYCGKATHLHSVEKQYNEANNALARSIGYLRKASDHGIVEASFALARMEWPNDIDAINIHYRIAELKSEHQEIAYSQFCLFGLLRDKSIPGFPEKNGLFYLKKSASRGYPSALFKLGETYYNGTFGCARDFKEAAKYFNLRLNAKVEAENTMVSPDSHLDRRERGECAYYLGMIYSGLAALNNHYGMDDISRPTLASNYGVQPDISVALHWFHLANDPNQHCQHYGPLLALVKIYFYGKDLPQNELLAASFFAQYLKEKPLESEQKESALEKASLDDFNAELKYIYARISYKGIGIPQNRPLAMKLLERSFLEDDPHAILWMQDILKGKDQDAKQRKEDLCLLLNGFINVTDPRILPPAREIDKALERIVTKALDCIESIMITLHSEPFGLDTIAEVVNSTVIKDYNHYNGYTYNPLAMLAIQFGRHQLLEFLFDNNLASTTDVMPFQRSNGMGNVMTSVIMSSLALAIEYDHDQVFKSIIERCPSDDVKNLTFLHTIISTKRITAARFRMIDMLFAHGLDIAELDRDQKPFIDYLDSVETVDENIQFRHKELRKKKPFVDYLTFFYFTIQNLNEHSNTYQLNFRAECGDPMSWYLKGLNVRFNGVPVLQTLIHLKKFIDLEEICIRLLKNSIFYPSLDLTNAQKVSTWNCIIQAKDHPPHLRTLLGLIRLFDIYNNVNNKRQDAKNESEQKSLSEDLKNKIKEAVEYTVKSLDDILKSIHANDASDQNMSASARSKVLNTFYYNISLFAELIGVPGGPFFFPVESYKLLRSVPSVEQCPFEVQDKAQWQSRYISAQKTCSELLISDIYPKRVSNQDSTLPADIKSLDDDDAVMSISPDAVMSISPEEDSKYAIEFFQDMHEKVNDPDIDNDLRILYQQFHLSCAGGHNDPRFIGLTKQQFCAFDMSSDLGLHSNLHKKYTLNGVKSVFNLPAKSPKDDFVIEMFQKFKPWSHSLMNVDPEKMTTTELKNEQERLFLRWTAVSEQLSLRNDTASSSSSSSSSNSSSNNSNNNSSSSSSSSSSSPKKDTKRYVRDWEDTGLFGNNAQNESGPQVKKCKIAN